MQTNKETVCAELALAMADAIQKQRATRRECKIGKDFRMKLTTEFVVAEVELDFAERKWRSVCQS